MIKLSYTSGLSAQKVFLVEDQGERRSFYGSFGRYDLDVIELKFAATFFFSCLIQSAFYPQPQTTAGYRS